MDNSIALMWFVIALSTAAATYVRSQEPRWTDAPFECKLDAAKSIETKSDFFVCKQMPKTEGK